MRKSQVEIGGRYVVRVSGVLTVVRIDRESQYGGWDGTNVDTGRKVRIRTAARLRYAARADATGPRTRARERASEAREHAAHTSLPLPENMGPTIAGILAVNE